MMELFFLSYLGCLVLPAVLYFVLVRKLSTCTNLRAFCFATVAALPFAFATGVSIVIDRENKIPTSELIARGTGVYVIFFAFALCGLLIGRTCLKWVRSHSR